MGSVRTFDSSIIVATDIQHAPSGHRAAWGPGFAAGDWETFNRALAVLTARGFQVTTDPHYDERYPNLTRRHRLGVASTPDGELRFTAEIYPVGCKIEFFQDVVVSNPNGGRYDFDRRQKMPYLIRRKFDGAWAALIEHLAGRGFPLENKVETATPALPVGARLAGTEGGALPGPAEISAAALAFFNDSWDSDHEKRRGVHRFLRDDSGWPERASLSVYHGLKDGDGEPLSSGVIRYARDLKGYLRRGYVFGGINGMWLFVFGPGARDFTHVQAGSLFTYRPGETPRKVHSRPVALTAVLAIAVGAQNFERAIQLRDLIRRRQPVSAAA